MQPGGEQSQRIVAVAYAPVAVHEHGPIRVTVQRYPQVGPGLKHGVAKRTQMECPNAGVDVSAIRRVSQGDHVGAQVLEKGGRQ